MATQAEYSVVANALVKDANAFLNAEYASLPGFAVSMLQQYLTPQKIAAGAGAAAKTAVDVLDAYRAKEKAS